MRASEAFHMLYCCALFRTSATLNNCPKNCTWVILWSHFTKILTLFRVKLVAFVRFHAVFTTFAFDDLRNPSGSHLVSLNQIICQFRRSLPCVPIFVWFGNLSSYVWLLSEKYFAVPQFRPKICKLRGHREQRASLSSRLFADAHISFC